MKCLFASGGRPCQLDEGHSGEHDYKPFPSFLDAVHARIDELERQFGWLRAAVIVSPAGLGGPLPMLELDGAAPSPGVAPAGLEGSLSLTPGATVVVLLKVGGLITGKVASVGPGGVVVDGGARVGVLTGLSADQVVVCPAGWVA